MKLPADIRFVGLSPSPAVEADIHERIAQLERHCPDVVAWRVAIEQEHRHQQQGRAFSVRVSVTLPGQELTVSRVHDPDVHVAVRDAFDAARRQVDDAVRIRRGQVKGHAEAPDSP